VGGQHGLLPSERDSVCGFLRPASCLAAPLCDGFGAILPNHGKGSVMVCDHFPQAAPISADGRGCAIARRTPAVVTTPWGADIWPVKVA
jgi:hypothetical protein